MQKIRVLALSGNYHSAGGGNPESLRLLARALKKTVIFDVLTGTRLYTDVGNTASLPMTANVPSGFASADDRDRSRSVREYALIMAFGAWISPKLWVAALRKYNGLKLPIIYLPRGSLSETEFIGITRKTKKFIYFYLLEHWIVRRSDVLIFSSLLEQNSASIIGKRRYLRALVAADPSEDGAETAGKSARAREDTVAWTIGLLAEIRPGKGIQETIEAFKILDRTFPGKFRLVIGGGAHRSAVNYTRRLENNLPKNVEFFGRVNPQNKDAFYSSIDAQIVPSRFESYSLVCAEAVARRIPLICSPFLGFLEGLEVDELNIGIMKSVTPEAIADTVQSFEFRFNNALQQKVMARSLAAAIQVEKCIINLVSKTLDVE